MTNNNDLISLIREKDTYAHKLGIEIIEAKDGRSHVTMIMDDTTANAIGNVHGIVIFSCRSCFCNCLQFRGDSLRGYRVEYTLYGSLPVQWKARCCWCKKGETRRLDFTA